MRGVVGAQPQRGLLQGAVLEQAQPVGGEAVPRARRQQRVPPVQKMGDQEVRPGHGDPHAQCKRAPAGAGRDPGWPLRRARGHRHVLQERQFCVRAAGRLHHRRARGAVAGARRRRPQGEGRRLHRCDAPPHGLRGPLLSHPVPAPGAPEAVPPQLHPAADDGQRADRQAHGRAADADVRGGGADREAGRPGRRAIHHRVRGGPGVHPHSRHGAGAQLLQGRGHLRRARPAVQPVPRGHRHGPDAAGGALPQPGPAGAHVRGPGPAAAAAVSLGPAEAHRRLLHERGPHRAARLPAARQAEAGARRAGVPVLRRVPADEPRRHPEDAQRYRRRQGPQHQGQVGQAGRPLRLRALHPDQRQQAQGPHRGVAVRQPRRGVLQDAGRPQGGGEADHLGALRGGPRRLQEHEGVGGLRARRLRPGHARDRPARGLHHETGPLPDDGLGDGAAVGAGLHGREPARHPRQHGPEGGAVPERRERRHEPEGPPRRVRGEVREARRFRLRHVPGRQHDPRVRAPAAGPVEDRELGPRPHRSRPQHARR
mmetsp:Transcript_20631/g.57814  ORF Transcript_20631/g.57814 Transcript_20631/m.57814 type:complete len:540 (-) Transcript_20631:692-2311(-)